MPRRRIGKLRTLLIQHGRTAVYVLAGIAAAAIALGYKLTILAPALAPGEQRSVAASAHLHTIAADPTNLPLKLLLWAALRLPLNELLTARLAAVAMALLALGLFVYVLHRWYGPRSTVFGFFLLLGSAWFLHAGRFAGTNIEYILAILLLIAAHIVLGDHSDSRLVRYAWLAANVLLLFIPGMVWLVLLGAALQIRTLITALRQEAGTWDRAGWIALALLGIGARGAALYYRPYTWTTWLGLPDHLVSWRALLARAGNTALTLVYQGPHDPQLWLGQLPVLDVFVCVMLAAGIVFYARHWRAQRTHLLAALLLLSFILVSVGGPVGVSVVIPVVYLIVVAGIAYVLHAWLRVFPRNPFARLTGIGTVSVVIVLSCVYGARQYFIAWPHNPETIAVYRRAP